MFVSIIRGASAIEYANHYLVNIIRNFFCIFDRVMGTLEILSLTRVIRILGKRIKLHLSNSWS